MTVSQLIGALGGPSELSRKLGGIVSPQAISRWVKDDRVPEGRRPAVMAVTAAAGLPIPKALQ
jgi:hypothetical protein